MNEIRQLEEFFSKPVRATLSVVIGLEIDASTILNIARVGEFAMEPPITNHGPLTTDNRLPSPVNRKQRPMSRMNGRLVDAENHGTES